MDDVKADRSQWRFCNFNDPGIGFPRDCGKHRPGGGNFMTTSRGRGY